MYSVILYFVYALLIGGFFTILGIGADDSDPSVWNVVAIALALITPPVVSSSVARKKEEQKYSEAIQWEDSKYQVAYRHYTEGMLVYEKEKQIFDASAAMFDLAIRKQEEMLRSAREQLDMLYSMHIVYPSFQNLIATYQIREYLSMGVCDTLEGPDGAYAQYMNDVRTARICDSIIDLKRSLISAINGLQGTLARELRQIDSNLDGIRSDMSASVQCLNLQMQQMHNASATQLDAYFNEANRQLQAINNSLAISEHNRYIERRLNKVDTYMMKLP